MLSRLGSGDSTADSESRPDPEELLWVNFSRLDDFEVRLDTLEVPETSSLYVFLMPVSAMRFEYLVGIAGGFALRLTLPILGLG